MVRKLFSGRVGLAVAAALGLAGLTSSSNAAEITFSLRAIGGAGTQSGDGKSVVLADGAAGQAVTLGLYAEIQNLDSNRANDGFRLVHTSLLSTEPAVGGIFGNIAPVTINTVYSNANPSLQASGVQNNLDGNADLEVGGLATNAAAGYVIVSNGNSANFGTGTGAGPSEFLLGTTTWTSGVNLPGSTDLNFFLRIRTDGNPVGQQTVQYTTDGLARSIQGSNGNASIALGAPINISIVPEPASLGLLGVGALAALRRRRSM